MMLLSAIINDSLGVISRQLKFYCWQYRRNLDHKNQQELIELLNEQHFESLARKIKNLDRNTIQDCKQQVGKLLFEHCLHQNRRNQIKQLVESKLVDIDVRLDNYGRTLLHRCAYNLDVELVKILINNGVDIRLRDYAGNTALHIAIQSYRNGAVIFGNEIEVVQNLTTIITLLVEADRIILQERRRTIDKNSIQTSHDENDNRPKLNSRCSSLDVTNNPDKIRCSESQEKRSLSDEEQLSKSFNRSKKVKTIDMNSIDVSFVGRHKQDDSHRNIHPFIQEDFFTSLIDTKNAFGRTALHYCVLVVGERYLSHFVQILIYYGAETDVIDNRMKTPLYCLVKRPNMSSVRQRCLAISHLLKSGCDDLGLAIHNSDSYFNDDFIKDLEQISPSRFNFARSVSDNTTDPILVKRGFTRVPNLKHLARLQLIRSESSKSKVNRQPRLQLPENCPAQLSLYVNKKILDQSELL